MQTTGQRNGDKRLRYAAPQSPFAIAAVAMLLFTYLALSSNASLSQQQQGRQQQHGGSHVTTRRALPQHYLDTLRTWPSPIVQHYVYPAAYAFEEHVMGTLYAVGVWLFGSVRGMQLACALAWLVHALELTYAVCVCVRLRASRLTLLRYVVGVALGGASQLTPLRRAAAAAARTRK